MNERSLRQTLCIIVLMLLGLGCMAVYSATAVPGLVTYGHSMSFVFRHVMAIAIGMVLAFGCLALPHPALQRWAKVLLLTSIVLLVLVRLFGQEINGAHRWFRIGRLSVEPSEFAQLALVLYLADFLSRKRAVIQEFREGFLPPILVTGLMAGLVLLQPDLGTAIVMGMVAMLLLVLAKARWQHLGFTAALGAVALVVLIAGEAYRRRRILAFLDPWQDPQGVGFQILQSYVALADGGIFGQGVGASMQKLFFLPSAHTDFIFAIIGEELGLLGTTAMITLFALFVGCGVRLAHLTDDVFSKYVICGCVALIACEAIVNMAVVTGLLPTKGLPLPLVSYGGTAMIGNLLACALMFRASRPDPAMAMESPKGSS